MIDLDTTGWQRLEDTREDEASLPLFRRLCSLLDEDMVPLSAGTVVPVAWAAILFSEIAGQSKLGGDGHPRHGDFIPPMPLPKRMFAGRSIEQFAPLRIGDRLVRRSKIADITPKQGRSGPLIFLTVVHEIAGESGPCFKETQQVVFREDGNEGAGSKAAEPLPEPSWCSQFAPDPVMLFRYSALTFNGHRIHYDAPYATDVEGYPSLVVNGGLTTLMLLEFARKSLGATPSRYSVRAIRPLFANNIVELFGAETGDGALFWATDTAGNPAMKVKIGGCE